MSVSRELGRYKLDLVRVQEVRWEGRGTEPAGEYTFFYGKKNENHDLSIILSVHKGIISAVKRVEFLTDRMSYIILRGIIPFVLKQKIKLTMWRTASMKNWNMCLINSLNTIRKFCYEISMQK
jgi:hypothetical protein